MTAAYADIRQRVYRGMIDTPKSENSMRKAALSEGLLTEIEAWRMMAAETRADAWVFPSERMTPLSKDNCWRRSMLPRLKKVGLQWANFQMRRTHATLMRQMKSRSSSGGGAAWHSVDVSLNVYAQSPVEGRLALVNQLEDFAGTIALK